MNIFRFCGDMLHLASILLLLWKIHKNKSCVGVSCRMQECYLIVFAWRYLDLLYEFINLYNSVMKIFFILSTGYLIYLMRFKPPVNQTYDRSVDSFKYEIYFLVPCIVVGTITCEEYSITEILWCSSIWLEAIAITPQLVLLAKMREVFITFVRPVTCVSLKSVSANPKHCSDSKKSFCGSAEERYQWHFNLIFFSGGEFDFPFCCCYGILSSILHLELDL